MHSILKHLLHIFQLLMSNLNHKGNRLDCKVSWSQYLSQQGIGGTDKDPTPSWTAPPIHSGNWCDIEGYWSYWKYIVIQTRSNHKLLNPPSIQLSFGEFDFFLRTLLVFYVLLFYCDARVMPGSELSLSGNFTMLCLLNLLSVNRVQGKLHIKQCEGTVVIGFAP